VTTKSIIDDDDPEPGLVSAEQVAKLQERIREADREVARFCRVFGIETLDQLPAAEFERGTKLLDRIVARRGLSHEEIERLDREEIDRALEQDPFLRRCKQFRKEGMSSRKAWDLALAEALAKGQPWSSRLLNLVAERFLEMHEPKLKARWEREIQPGRDRATIDALAERLKANNVRAYRSNAEKLYAEIFGITVHALRKRLQRRKKV
jgi:hypothetical protein